MAEGARLEIHPAVRDGVLVISITVTDSALSRNRVTSVAPVNHRTSRETMITSLVASHSVWRREWDLHVHGLRMDRLNPRRSLAFLGNAGLWAAFRT